MNAPFTAEQLKAAREGLFAQGESVQSFCQTHGLSYCAVMGVLHNRSRATRGDGHRAAVLLGLKTQPKPKRSPKAPSASQSLQPTA